MFQIDALSRTPIYEQIIQQMERYITSGLLTAGTQLPSVRKLSIELHINPNTIQKAYSELDLKGIIQSVPGKGCFVCADAPEKLRQGKRRLLEELTAMAHELAAAGIEKDTLLACIHEAYTKKDTEEKLP